MKVDQKYSNPTKFRNRRGLIVITAITAGALLGVLSIVYLIYQNNFVGRSRARQVQVETPKQGQNQTVEKYLKYSECLSEGGSDEKCSPLLKEQ
ncbi:hypothetical protein [Scytonema sp. NUACC21]